MKFYNELGELIDHRSLESIEQHQASQYIHHNAVVLELGARYGTVTCAISAKLANKEALVTVEPDARVWQALEGNIARNNCKAHIVKGFISSTPMSLSNHGYGSTSSRCSDSTISNVTLAEIQEKYSVQFDTLVADCEGFLEQFFDENPTFMDKLTLVIFEKDYPQKCNYAKIDAALKERGFTCIVNGFHSVWKK
jgi:FkbM family methyltransferase